MIELGENKYEVNGTKDSFRIGRSCSREDRLRHARWWRMIEKRFLRSKVFIWLHFNYLVLVSYPKNKYFLITLSHALSVKST